MKTQPLPAVFLLVASSFSTAYASHGGAFANDFINNKHGEPYLQVKEPSSHRHVTATVERIVSGTVFVRTRERTIRNLGMIEVRRDGMPSLRSGDQVDLILDRGNSVLAIAPPNGTGAYIGDDIAGTVQHFDILNRRIALKTEDGAIESFDLRNAVATKLNGVKKGRKIILEMDGQHRAFDAYRAERL
jgi:hypothetical protein